MIIGLYHVFVQTIVRLDLAYRKMDQENQVGVKTCPRCQTEKPFDDYWTHKTRKDGLQGWCKACYSDREREGWKTQRLKRQRDEETGVDSESEMPCESEPVKEEPKNTNDSLYIFRNPCSLES